MAERKPPGKSWETWIDEQIRAAQAAGEFEGLEGAGRPLPGIDAPYDPQWWVKKLIEREKISMLPPALEIRGKVARELAALLELAREDDVRARLSALNAEIARANRTVAEGPATNLAPIDVDAAVQEWRRQRGG
jgi:hypothetical protein